LSVVYVEFDQDLNSADFEAKYNNTVAKNGDIVFAFTEKINKSLVKIGNTVTVNADATLKWDDTTLTITPLHQWEDDIIVTFNELKSTSGKTFGVAIKRENPRDWESFDLNEYQYCDNYSCVLKYNNCAEFFNDYLVQRGYVDYREILLWGFYTLCEATWEQLTYEVSYDYNPSIPIALKLKDLSTAAVDGIAVISPDNFNYNATTADLRWNIVEGAESYAIYRKNDLTSSYVKVGSSHAAIKGATIGHANDVSLGGALHGRTVSFIVRAENRTSISPLYDSLAVKVMDKIKPTLIASSNPKCLAFSEPINKKDLVIAPSTDIDPTNERMICIDPVVPGTYTISNIKDQYGNLYGTAGTGTITITPTP
jgi:hypothetical protein